MLKNEERDIHILLGEFKLVEISGRQSVIHIKSFYNVYTF